MSGAWTLLIVAGLLEIVWAVGLKYTQSFTRLLPSTITLIAMVLSIVLLARALRTLRASRDSRGRSPDSVRIVSSPRATQPCEAFLSGPTSRACA